VKKKHILEEGTPEWDNLIAETDSVMDFFRQALQ